MATYDDYRTRREIEIIIQDRNAENGAGGSKRRRRGVLPSANYSRTPKRRLANKIYLNFYDFGQFTTGGAGWQDTDYIVSPAFVGSIGAGNVQNITLAAYDALRTLLFDTPKEQWNATFRKFGFDDGYKYGVDVQITGADGGEFLAVAKDGSRNFVYFDLMETPVFGSKWTQNGLEIAKQTAQNLAIYSNAGFPSLNFAGGADSENVKVTTAPEYSADAASFILDKSADLFLVPAFWKEHGAFFDAGFNLNLLNYLFVPASRRIWIENLPTGETRKNGIASPFIYLSGFSATPRNATTDEIISFIRSRSAARLYDTAAAGFTDPLGFPFAPSGDAQNLSVVFGNFINDDDYLTIPAGAFVGAANKGGEWFYFWNKQARRNSQGASLVIPSPNSSIIITS